MASFSYPIGFVWLIIISGAESFLTYNPQGQELRFQCPMPSGMTSLDRLVQARVSRLAVNGGKATVLAEWRLSQGQGKGESFHDRVTVPNGSTNYLEATMQHVTCYDSATYTYECVTTVDTKPFLASYSRSFQFIGEISPPYLSQEPLKSRYKAGELLSLSCTASVGTEDNGIVWEAGFPGGPFSNVTGEENPATGRAYEEAQVIRPDCNRESRFPLKYRVKAMDDGKVFQCRLRRTGQTTRMTIAVQRDEEMCASSLLEDKTDSETVELELEAGKQATKSEYKELSAERDDDADVGAMATSYWLIIVVGILVTVAIVAFSVIIVLRQRKGKQEQPLVVVEAPSSGSASSSESSYSDRDLPGLPDLNSTTPRWIAESRHRHLENIQQPYRSLGTSVYVSMTAVDRCDATVPPPEEEAGDSLPDMRMDHSESVYSNQSTIDGESAASKSSSAATVAAASATTTAAAATAAAAATVVAPTAAPVAVVAGGGGGGDVCVEELKYGNDDESVFIPTFIESI